MLPEDLPEYSRPPVVEVVMVVVLEGIVGFFAAHHGLFWSRIRESYPRAEEQPPLFFQQEAPPGVVPVRPQFPPEVLSQPTIRSWFLHVDGAQVVQVQNDAFIRNWRKVRDRDVYPRYPAVREAFLRDFSGFLTFVDDMKLGRVTIKQCELSYVNHITLPDGSPHERFGDVLNLWQEPSSSLFLPTVEDGTLTARYPIYVGDQFAGRLNVSAQAAYVVQSNQKIMNLTLAARSKPASMSIEDATGFFDVAHEWIVRGFSELTRPKMHQLWGRTR
jgi:uncharacterized protein (TIGR04255 family)